MYISPPTPAENLYLKTAAPAPITEPRAGDASAIVGIVGAGYTGLSTALHLAEKGVSTIVLDASEIGWGCSGRNGGQVNSGLKADPVEVEHAFGRERGRRMLKLAYGGPDEVFDLIRRFDIDCAARQSGTIRAAFSEAGGKAAASLVSQCVERDVPVELLSRQQVAERTGTSRYHSAWFDPRGGQLNPLGYARGLARAAIAAGARIHTRTPALSVQSEGLGWRIDTPTGKVRVEKLVIATNGYTGDLWPRLKTAIVPVYSSIVATDPLPAELAASIMPTRSVLYETGRVTVYYRIDDQGRLLMGGRGKQAPSDAAGDYAHLVAYAERLWPALKGQHWPHRWYGQVAMTRDHYPILAEPSPNAFVALGYNGRGVAMATLIGRLLADRLAGVPEEEIVFPIRRDFPTFAFHRFWKLGVLARVVSGRVQDAMEK